MALECIRRKIAGVVIWGAVRDAAIIERLKFPVFCTALSPMSPVKRRFGVVGKAITVSGIRIEPGDQIIADRDGVVLVPASKWLDAIASISQVRARERDIKRRMKAGAALSEILGIPYE